MLLSKKIKHMIDNPLMLTPKGKLFRNQSWGSFSSTKNTRPNSSLGRKSYQNKDNASNVNMLNLIIQSNPSQFDVGSIRNKILQMKKMVLPQYLSNSNHLFYRYNVLYASKTSNLIRTYSPKLRPRSASVQQFTKNIASVVNKEVFNEEEIGQLFEAKCLDLNVRAQPDLQIRFKDFVMCRCVNGVIDLSECNIGKNSISVISAALLNDDNISRVILRHNQIGDRGLEMLIPVLKMSNSIVHLDLSSNDIGPRSGAMLLEMLKSHSSIISLNISSLEGINRNRLTAEGIKPIDALLKNNKYIEMLNISGNSIKNEGLKHLACGLNENDSLKDLDISNNDIDIKGIEVMSSYLTSSQVISLNLGGNPLHNDGLVLLAKCLMSDALRTVNSINLTDCKITMEGLQQFFRKLTSNITLNYLTFNRNYLSSKGFLDIEIPLSTMNIKFLGLSGCSIGKNAYDIAELLESNSSIKSIDLSNNQMGDKGFVHFTSVVSKNYSLESIDFSKNLLTDESGKDFFPTLEFNHTIKHLHFYDNQFQTTTAHIIHATLRNNKTLVTLNIGRNQIQMKMMRKIGALIHRNKLLLKRKYTPSIKMAIKSLAFNDNEYDVLREKIELQKREQENLKEKIIEDTEKYSQMKQVEAVKIEEWISKGEVLKSQVGALDEKLRCIADLKEAEGRVFQERRETRVIETNETNDDISALEKEHTQYEIERELVIADLNGEIIKKEASAKLSNDKLQLIKLSAKMIEDELKEKKMKLKRLTEPVETPVAYKEEEKVEEVSVKKAKISSKRSSRLIRSKSIKDNKIDFLNLPKESNVIEDSSKKLNQVIEEKEKPKAKEKVLTSRKSLSKTRKNSKK